MSKDPLFGVVGMVSYLHNHRHEEQAYYTRGLVSSIFLFLVYIFLSISSNVHIYVTIHKNAINNEEKGHACEGNVCL